jgi:hypothetical protein
MFSWINLNHKEGLRRHKYISKSHWADLRWTFYRRDVGETLSDFAFRVGISYSMAKKHSREKKLYRHKGRWFFISNSVLEPFKDLRNIKKGNLIRHYDIYMDTVGSDISEDSHLFKDMNLMELERPPPLPPPIASMALGAIELAELWD